MGIEEDIRQQKKFVNEYEKLIVNLMFTSSWLDGMRIQNLKPFGISPQQYNVLRILRGAFPEPVRLADITDRMIDKNSNATRLVEKLRQKGFLKREICKQNRRQVDIWITPKGLELLTETDKLSGEWLKVFKTIQKTEAQELNRILDKLRS
ncbi:MarR family transcriptional regulator [soil metagenome]